MKPETDYIDKLTGLSEYLEKHADLDESLKDLAAKAADILNAQNSSIMLFKDCDDNEGLKLRISAHFGRLPEEAFDECMDLQQGISGHVVATGKPLLIEDIDQSRFAPVARKHYPGRSFMSAPVIINKKVIGVIHVNTHKQQRVFNKEDLNLLTVVAMLVSKSIQIIQVQKLMMSRYTVYAVAEKNKEELTKLTNLVSMAGQDLNKVAKLLAKTFYREMSKAGFGPDHIISAASEIISLLNESVVKHKKRRERT
jgi:signal transduction protein with GAF and PtsI domain